MAKNAFYDTFFRATHGGRLIYNSCWEDPRADRALLGLGPDARIAMITSAGCNALDYLLDDPKEIHCIDVNPRQNALLELKLAAIKTLPFDDFFAIFGKGSHPKFETIYQDGLRKELSSAARQYWDAHQHYFSPRSLRGSFYFYGASGDVAYFVRSFLRYLRPGLHRQLLALLDCQSLAEQASQFERIEAKLFSPALQWLVRQPMLLSLLGVPRAQRDLITRQFEGGVSAFVRTKLRHVFTKTDLRENYFWRVYLHGSYSSECCPNYLRAENYERLKARLARIRLHHMTVDAFLADYPGTISHFVLLDHQDWMASEMPAELASEWRSIIRRAASPAKVLLRSAAQSVDFLPEFVQLRTQREMVGSQFWQQHDRVGTYGCTWLGELNSTDRLNRVAA